MLFFLLRSVSKSKLIHSLNPAMKNIPILVAWLKICATHPLWLGLLNKTV